MTLKRKNYRRKKIVINSISVKERNEVILLGITTDNKHIEISILILRTYAGRLNINAII